MSSVTKYKLAASLALSVVAGTVTEARGDDSFRCGTHLVQLGEAPSSVERACGKPTDIRVTSGYIRHQNGTAWRLEYETWTYDLGPVTFARILVFSDGALTSIRTGDYGN